MNIWFLYPNKSEPLGLASTVYDIKGPSFIERIHSNCLRWFSTALCLVSEFRNPLNYHISLPLCPFAQALSPSNMHLRFSVLLWLEELHAEKEIREFTIIGALLRKGVSYLHLEVVGLAEGRPSLGIGEEAWIVFLCWIIATVHVIYIFILATQERFWQVCSAGDRIVLKKPQRDGVVVEYLSYVAEVRRYYYTLNICFYVLHYQTHMPA